MTMQDGTRPTAGAIALVGSGEYLHAMDSTDRYLIETLGGADKTRVVLLPTASGLEVNGPSYWNELGQRHFQSLGVQDIRPSAIINRTAASDSQQLALLRGANFYYFSGGNPQHTIETLRNTPAWEIITAAHAHGAVLAGCSAGAMMMSGHTVNVRQAMTGGKLQLTEALGVVPHVVVFPHFDRMSGFIDQNTFQALLAALPAGHLALGIDENTALVRVTPPQSAEPLAAAHWQVMGKQTVSIYERGKERRVLHVGDSVNL